MGRWILAALALAFLALAARSTEPASRATVLAATIRFGRTADPDCRGKLLLEGDVLAGPGIRNLDPRTGGLRVSVGPAVLLDGTPPVDARFRDRGERGWILTVRRPFEGRGKLTLRLFPESGIFRLKASGFRAAALLDGGPAGVSVEFLAGVDGGVDAVDFSSRGARRWDYIRPPQVRPVPGGQQGAGGGSGGPPITPAWREISTSYDSGVANRRDVVVRDAETFAALWAEVVSGWQVPAPAPAVDFEHEMVLGAFLGTPANRTGPFATSIVGVTFSSAVNPAAVTVAVHEFMTVRAPSIYFFNGPYCLVVCPKVDAPVVFQHTVINNP